MDSKIIITNDADQLLESMLNEVNTNFPSGRVKKAQLASWIIRDFSQRCFAKMIEKIREDHFDKIAHLKSVLKEMEEAKKSSRDVELEKLLSPLKSYSAKPRKTLEEVNPKSEE